MAYISRLSLPLLLILAFCTIGATNFQKPKSGKTSVYVVRHAEKDISDKKNTDPALSEAGKVRAADLTRMLSKQKFAAVFSTNYIRTKATVSELAQKNGLVIEIYDPRKPDVLTHLIKTKYSGKKVLIAGHSNTVLELVEALGGHRPLKELTEEDYDLLFQLKLKSDKISLKTIRYGAPHHVTPLASK